MKIPQLLTKVLTDIGEPGPYRFVMGRGGDTAVSVKVVAKRRDLFAKIHENAILLMCEQAALTALSSFVKTPRVVS